MIQVLLTIFTVLFLPIPWLIIAIHILINSKHLDSTISKVLLVLVSLIIWGLLGYWLLNNNEFLFANQFNNVMSQVAGIAILMVAVAIEFLTHKALSTSRIFGSSEFKHNKDKLITHGIYKYARHPRYIEHPLWALGVGLTFGYSSLIWFFFYLLVSFIIVAYFEEQELIKRYGKQYLEYKKKVPAFFI